MGTPNPAISVRFSEDRRPEVQRFAALVGMSEGQLLKMCFEDIAILVKQKGEEKLPRLVHLIRAAQEYEASKPALSLQKLDKGLRSGYADGTYKVATSARSGLVSEKKGKQGKI